MPAHTEDRHSYASLLEYDILEVIIRCSQPIEISEAKQERDVCRNHVEINSSQWRLYARSS